MVGVTGGDRQKGSRPPLRHARRSSPGQEVPDSGAMFGSKSGSKKLRLAYGRIAQETNALSPVLTTLEDFHALHYLEGSALRDAVSRSGVEAKGFLKSAELKGFAREAERRGPVELVPTISAWAVPSGKLDRRCFETLRDALVERLASAGPLDGVFLSLHGSMGAEGTDDPESDILAAVREVVGDVPVVASLDLHANLSERRVALSTSLCGYHTNPHRDHVRTGARAAEILVRAARGEVRPITEWRSLPMLLGGGTTIDLLAPMRAIYARCRDLPKRDRRVLSASVFMVHPWLDCPEVGWSVHVTTDGDRALASRLAEELAESCWAVRHQQPPTFLTASDAIQRAKDATVRRKAGVIVLSDASDVVSAGSTGDSTKLLAALASEADGLVVYTCIQDAVAARALYDRPEGTEVELEVGGTRDPGRHRPLRIRGVLKTKREDPGLLRRVRVDLDPIPGRSSKDAPRISLVIVEGPALVMKPAFYREMGLRMRHADVVVVKNFFPFRIFFLPYARATHYVRTGGITDPDAAFGLPLHGPVHPRDAVDDWRAVDARRRGLSR
jgi:microcystin degradation protein MlrC